MNKFVLSFIIGALLGALFAYVYNANIDDDEHRHVHVGSYALATAVQFLFLAVFGWLLKERFTL